VDLTVANAVLLASRSGVSKTDICDRSWIHGRLDGYLTIMGFMVDWPAI